MPPALFPFILQCCSEIVKLIKRLLISSLHVYALVIRPPGGIVIVDLFPFAKWLQSDREAYNYLSITLAPHTRAGDVALLFVYSA